MNFKNNAFSVLAAAAGSGDTTLTLSAGTGSRFPTSDFLVTLIGYDGAGNENAWEIVLCTARAADTLTVVRGQEGTAAVAWANATRVENRVTAGTMDEVVQDSVRQAPVKATPVDSDEMGFLNSVAGAFSLVRMTFGDFKTWLSGLFVSRTAAVVDGNLNFSGTGRRITGDFSNATVANRLMFQTSTANADTTFSVLPSGTSTTSRVNLYNASSPENASRLTFAVSAGAGIINSTKDGSGTSLPLTFLIGDVERLRIDTSGNVLLTGGGGLGYGIGSGGTVTQPTSKSTAVTLNKPVGRITMNGAPMAAGATASFNVNNSLVTEFDSVIVTGLQIHDWSKYVLRASVSAGVFIVHLKNDSAGVLAEPLVLNFAVINGATS